MNRRASETGVALVVALILLVVIILLGLAAVRNTTVQQKMSGNFYDRELAFQTAEAALQAATNAIGSNAAGIVNCAPGGQVCLVNPFTDHLPAGAIQMVPTGTGAGQFTISGKLPPHPQYVIENMGQYADASTSTGYGQTANASQYGAQGTSTTSIYYRITARSADPAKVGDRAIVTLQAMYRQ